MINSTERARDALCGDRQTAVSSEDISLKSKVLVLMCCRFSGEAVKSAWSHLKALNSITAKHTLGCKDSNELSLKALPVVLGWPHSRELCCPHWRLLRRPLSTLTWSGATVRDAHGVAETIWWARWEVVAGQGAMAGALGSAQRCARFPGPADGTHIARSCCLQPHTARQIPHRSPLPCLAVQQNTHHSLGLWVSLPTTQSFSSLPRADNHGWLQLYLDYRLSCTLTGSCTSCQNAWFDTQSPMEQPELHSPPLHLHVGTAKLAEQVPGWLFRGETPTWVETESFCCFAILFLGKGTNLKHPPTCTEQPGAAATFCAAEKDAEKQHWTPSKASR